MKKIQILLICFLASATFFSCNKKDDVVGAIYAPNNALVSDSEESLRKTIGEVLHEDKVAINKIEFLDVKEGFIAELDVATPEASHKKVFYISSELRNKLVYDSSIEVVETNASGQRGPNVSVTCNCAIASPASSGCVSCLDVGPDVITASCTDVDCTSSCTMIVEIGFADL